MNFIPALSECGKSYIFYSFRTLTYYSILRISHFFFEKIGFSEKLTIFERIASKMIELFWTLGCIKKRNSISANFKPNKPVKVLVPQILEKKKRLKYILKFSLSFSEFLQENFIIFAIHGCYCKVRDFTI